MTEDQLYKAARAMQSMGSFAAAIGEAYFVADSHNRENLIQAFRGLFERAIEQSEPSFKDTRDFMLDVISADGPCTLKHVLNDCKFQGFTKGFTQALQSLKNDGLIRTDCEDGEITVELI